MPSSRPLRDSILSKLTELKRAVHPRELAARLALEWEDQEEFFQWIAELTDHGLLKNVPGGRIKLGPEPIIEVKPAPRKKERENTRWTSSSSSTRDSAESSPKARVTTSNPPARKPERAQESWDGVLSMHARGFGFVTATTREDVFIPPDAIHEAVHGDTVHIQIAGRSPRGAEGRIISVVKRRNPRVAGVVHRRKKSCWLEPDDSRLRGPITIVEGEESVKDGMAAIVDIVRFPLFADELCEAKIVQVLGPPGDPETEVKKILLREQVSEEHSPATLQNAAEMAELLRKPSLDGRRDLRRVPLPTIDPDDARDHDDAVWVERKGKGYQVYVAIADVSEYVREESALDEEARARGCTIYLPNRAIPMLPSVLAADLCSLLPDVERYCLCVIAELDAYGHVTDFELVEGVMRSAAKLTYGGVARTLGFDEESPQSQAAEAMKSDLQVLAELSGKLRKNRMTRGALDLDLPEARVLLDTETGAPLGVTKRATRPGLKKAYSLIEELMLLANELVAQWLTKKQAPAIYRIHGLPDSQKLEKLAAIGQKLNVPVDIDRLLEPLGASEFLKEIQGHERQHVLQLLMLRSLKQAQYAIDNEGHFGLASDCYLHFTSPIRRYPDLCVHRQVKKLLRGGSIDNSAEAVENLRQSATESSSRERAAMEVEREVVDLYRAIYMQQHIGEIFEGRVSAITGGGIYLQIEEPFCDVMMRFESMGPDRYETSEDELSVVGARSGDTLTLGDMVSLEIEDVALLRRTVYARRHFEEEELAALRENQATRPGRIPGRGAPQSKLGETPRRGSHTQQNHERSSSRPGAGDRGGERAKGSFKPSREPRAGAERTTSAPGSRAERPRLKTGLVKKPGDRFGAKPSNGKRAESGRKKQNRKK